MKSFLKICILFLICGVSLISSSSIFAGVFDTIKLNDNPIQENTDTNIKGAQLIEKYLLDYNKELKNFKDTHAIKDDSVIENTMEKIQTMIFALRKIQTNKVEKETAQAAMREAINEIKKINSETKNYLKTKTELIKNETKLIQEKYLSIIIKTSKKLENIIFILRQGVQKRGNIGENSRKITLSLDELEKQNTRLKNFKNMTFSHPKELKETLRSILLAIKDEFSKIRVLLR